MVEYWNYGIMGDLVLNNVEGGKMEDWFVGKISLDKEINTRVISF